MRLMFAVALVALLLFASQSWAQLARPAADRTGDSASAFAHSDPNLAWQAAVASRRPMLVYVTSDNCFYCKKMVTETWSHPQIRAGVAHFCEAITINATHAPELAKQLGVRAYPTTLVISPDAQLLCRIEGFANPQKFAEQMWPVLRAAEADRLAARPAAAAPAAMAPASHQPLYRPAAAGGR